MAWYEDMFKMNTAGGVAAGAAALLLAPVVSPVVTGAVRPLAKAAVKTGLILYDQGREVVTGVLEAGEDLVAEARAEMGRGEGATVVGAMREGMSEATAGARRALGTKRDESADETRHGGKRSAHKSEGDETQAS